MKKMIEKDIRAWSSLALKMNIISAFYLTDS